MIPQTMPVTETLNASTLDEIAQEKKNVPTDRRSSLQYPLWVEHWHFLRQQNPSITFDNAILDFCSQGPNGQSPYALSVGEEIDHRYDAIMATCDKLCGPGNCPNGPTYCAQSKNEIKALLGLPIID